MFTAEPVAEGTKDPTSGDRWARGCTAGGALTWQGTDAEPAARGEPGAPCCEPRTRRSRAEAARPSPARRPGQPGPDGLAAGGGFGGSVRSLACLSSSVVTCQVPPCCSGPRQAGGPRGPRSAAPPWRWGGPRPHRAPLAAASGPTRGLGLLRPPRALRALNTEHLGPR